MASTTCVQQYNRTQNMETFNLKMHIEKNHFYVNVKLKLKEGEENSDTVSCSLPGLVGVMVDLIQLTPVGTSVEPYGL